MRSINVEELNCVICNNPFFRYTKVRGGKKSVSVRGVGTITCSKKCSLKNSARRKE